MKPRHVRSNSCIKRSSFDLDPTLHMRFVSLNLSCYNSSDRRLRLNHFKTIHQRIDCATYPPSLSDYRRPQLIIRSDTLRAALSPVQNKMLFKSHKSILNLEKFRKNHKKLKKKSLKIRKFISLKYYSKLIQICFIGSEIKLCIFLKI